MLSSKHKPNTLNFKDYGLPTNGGFTPSTPTVISLLQDLTPTNYGYMNFDISDKDEVLRQFTMHYKSIEDSHMQSLNETQLNYSINSNNNNNFTLDLLNCDDGQSDINISNYSTSFDNLNRPLPSESACSSDVQSCSSNNESNSSRSHAYIGQSAKKRERNRLAAEKCRLKKQGRIKELENEKRKRIQENNLLVEKVNKRKETIKKLKIFYKKLQMGEFKPQPFY